MKQRATIIISLLVLLLCVTGSALTADIRSGIVLTGKHAGKYTMMLIEEGGEQHWIASTFIDVTPGDRIEFMGGILMRDFYSATMDRTFAEILLVTNIRIVVTEKLPGDAEKSQTLQ